VRTPAKVVGFFAEGDFLIGCGDDQEPHVVMLVGVVDELAVLVSCGDEVYVEIEGDEQAVGRRERELRKAGFFTDFAQGDLGDVGFAVGVAAGLEPAVEFRVMHQEAF